MKTLIPIVLITLGILYVVTPYNLLPSFIPVIGWIDDIAVTALMIYYMKFGRLPDFINRFLGRMAGPSSRQTGAGTGGGAKGSYGSGGYGGGSYGGDRQHNGPRTGGSGGPKSPREVLGVSPNASMKEIHSAYRKLVQQYHPDKVSHLGEEIQETARRKFLEIQSAYEALTGNRR